MKPRRIVFFAMLISLLILTGANSVQRETETLGQQEVSLPEEILTAFEQLHYTNPKIRQYDSVRDKQDFEVCHRIFNEIEQGDWSGVVETGEYYYFWGAYSGDYAEGISFIRTDVNGDSMPELINCYENNEGKLAVNFIFAYIDGRVELVKYDLDDPMEFYFLGEENQLLYEYGVNGGGGRARFSLMAFDENWEPFSRCTLSLYCLFDLVIGEKNEEWYRENFRSTYGTYGNGLYCLFEQTERPDKGIKGVEIVLSADQFELAYAQLTGSDFRERNEDWIWLLGDCSPIEGEYTYSQELLSGSRFEMKLDYELKVVWEEEKYIAYINAHWTNSFTGEKNTFLAAKAKVLKVYDSYYLYFLEDLSKDGKGYSFQPETLLFMVNDYAKSGNRLAIGEAKENLFLSAWNENEAEGYFVRRVSLDDEEEREYPYLQAYREFILSVGRKVKGECPIRGYYLEDLNYDQIPELAVLYETRKTEPGAAQYDYLRLYCFNGAEVVPVLTEEGEPVKIYGQAQILLDKEQKKTYLLQEIVHSQYVDSDHGYLKVLEEKNGVPYVQPILELKGKGMVGFLDEEDELLAQEHNEDRFDTRFKQKGFWTKVTNAEYIRIKRKYIPDASAFESLWNTNSFIAGEEDECEKGEKEVNWIAAKEEIDVLFWRWMERID